VLGFTFGYEILRALLKRAGIARTAWGRRARSIGGLLDNIWELNLSVPAEALKLSRAYCRQPTGVFSPPYLLF